ncbi:MAG: 2-oxoacid:ferredoxin oxidoreductase subunit alpha [Thaumarchaeota archaeon]|nr:2-oxoacid:ferredoxin oxidoreductase subunit alpha [Nitrososphaerota archaeon]
MKRNDFSWMTGGAQGSGIDTSANIFAKAAAQGGLQVFGNREYYSNIKGEHSYFRVRLSTDTIRSHVDTVDMLATFDDETVARHAGEVRKDGAIIYDPALGKNTIEQISTIEANVRKRLYAELDGMQLPHTVEGVLEVARRRGVHIYAIPYMDLLKKVGEKIGETSLSSLTRMTNVMAVAASFALLGYPEANVSEAIRKQFKAKPKVAEMNVTAISTAYEYVTEKYNGGFGYKLNPVETSEKRMFLRGSSTIGIAKILAGCRLQTYYPITPASDESEYLEAHENIDMENMEIDSPIASEAKTMQTSIAVVQTEDEIAAITMAVGGALTGVRSSTATSGPGFSLMAEGIGWAGINEVPVVVTLYQRGGPSTGLPTRHEQGDLRFALHIGHGDFPRIVLASGDLEEAFYDVAKTFNYAEKYQMPVIHIVDKAMANSDQTYKVFDPALAKIERGALITDGIQADEDAEFLRFKWTESGISPRPAIGTKGGIYWNTGDEHDEKGHISEDPTNRNSMMEKRMRKLDVVAREIPLEEKVHFYGPKDAQVTLVSWGSTKGPILDAMEVLKGEGISVNFLQIRLIQPFPTEYVKGILSNAKKIVDVEMNYTGQLGGVIREMTCVPVEQYILKYNGRPMSQEEIYGAVRQIAEGKAPNRVVLTNGA